MVFIFVGQEKLANSFCEMIIAITRAHLGSDSMSNMWDTRNKTLIAQKEREFGQLLNLFVLALTGYGKCIVFHPFLKSRIKDGHIMNPALLVQKRGATRQQNARRHG
jgi:hypothetical protein